MIRENSPNHEQIALWNSSAGRAWTESQAFMDQMLLPFEQLLVEVVGTGPCSRLLDIGCGTGATTLALGRSLGPQSQCIGVDVSEPMLALARARAKSEPSPPSFILADAQTHAFAPESFDALVSRFGVMFFADPPAAFANLRRAARPGARLLALTWRSAAENPFMTSAERAAAPFLPELPPRRPNEPGQFAFAEPERVRGILTAGGFGDVVLEPVDRQCRVPTSELVQYVTRFGPLGRVFAQADTAIQARVLEEVLSALAPYVRGSEVQFDSACWLVRARAS
jgi:SAM-dependent methyltransferase